MNIKIRSFLNPIGLALLATIVACGDDVGPQEEQLRPVRYFMVDADSGTRLRSFSGLSKSSTESRISFKVPGTVTDVPVQIGQRLEAGDLIAELGLRPLAETPQSDGFARYLLDL